MARVRVIAGPDAGAEFDFSDRLIFGRSNSTRVNNTCFANLSDSRVSREHLVIFRKGVRYYAQDKFSSNGTYVEGRRIEANLATLLTNLGQLQIGSTILLFSDDNRQAGIPEKNPATERAQVVNPSLIIDAKGWLEKLQAAGPAADARNLSRQIKAITQVSLALGGTTDVSQLTDQIIRSLFEVFQNADNIFLFSYNQKTDEVASLANSSDVSQARQQVSSSIINQVVRERNAILIYDAINDELYEDQESVHALQLRSVICAPLLFKDQVLGLVQIDSRTDANRFCEEDLEILTGISAQIAVAMKNADLFRDIENLLEGFVSASVQVIESRDPVTAGHSFRVATYAETLALAVSRHDDGPLKQVDFSDKQIRELRYASLLHDFGKVGVSEQILTKENKLFKHQVENIRMRFEYAKACAERHLFYRILKNHETKYLSKRQLQERIDELHMQLQKSHVRLDEFLEEIIRSNRPNLTFAEMTKLLAEIYQQNFEDLEASERPLLTDFEFEALQIPRGSLTAEERREIEMHVTHTYNFLNLIPWTENLKNIPDITFAHHEKLDGSGYPNSLKAEDIPLQSRIMTIADIYDALTAPDRPYKSSVVPEVALDMLQQQAQAGKLDQDLVQVYIESKSYLN